MFEVFEHTADLGLRITSPDLDSLFIEAGRSFFSIIVENLENVRPAHEMNFQIEGIAPDYLLFDWLNELLFTFETQHMLFSEFEVKVNHRGLVAKAMGEPFNRNRHRPDHEVKAITYHGLKVEQTTEGWLAELIVDI